MTILYARLETKESEKELYRLARQRDRAGKDVQHVRVIKDENGNVMVNSEAVLKRWKEYFEKLMNEENNSDSRTEEAEVVNESLFFIQASFSLNRSDFLECSIIWIASSSIWVNNFAKEMAADRSFSVIEG